MKKVLTMLLILFLVLGSTTGAMAKPQKYNSNNIVEETQQELSQYLFQYYFPETVIVGEEVEGDITLLASQIGKSGYPRARILFSVSSNDLEEDDKVTLVGKDENNTYTFTLEDEQGAVWGPTSFELGADYEDTTNWTLKFPKPGEYEILFTVVDITESKYSDNYIIAEESLKVVVNPLVLKGFIKEKHISGTYYQLNDYRLTGDYDFEDYEDEFVIAEGYPDISPSIYMVKSFYVEDLDQLDDGDEVTLSGKIQRVDVKNGTDYYTLEGCTLLATSEYDNSDFASYYHEKIFIEIEGTVDEDDQGVKVWEVSELDVSEDEDDNDNNDDNNNRVANGNTHGLVNALRNHLKTHNNGSAKSLRSTQRIMELLRARGYEATELDELLKQFNDQNNKTKK